MESKDGKRLQKRGEVCYGEVVRSRVAILISVPRMLKSQERLTFKRVGVYLQYQWRNEVLTGPHDDHSIPGVLLLLKERF